MSDQKGRKVARTALGRGLSALISTPPVALNSAMAAQDATGVVDPAVSTDIKAAIGVPSNQDARSGVQMIAVEEIANSASQPRQIFSENEIKELSDSIRTLGILQPILVRPKAGEQTEHRFELVAGERRWRAARLADLRRIPALVRDLSDKEALEIALVENVQRENLNPVEEARGYQRLMQEFNLSQQDVAERVGKDRATVANAVRILKLPQEIQDLVQKNELSVGHAKALLSLREEAGQLSLARKAIREGLSVRALEHLVQQVAVLDAGHRIASKNNHQEGGGKQEQSDSVYLEVIDRMRRALGTKVSIKHHESGRGRVEIEYFSEGELDRIIEKICGVA